jgi:hypothetical protein
MLVREIDPADHSSDFPEADGSRYSDLPELFGLRSSLTRAVLDEDQRGHGYWRPSRIESGHLPDAGRRSWPIRAAGTGHAHQVIAKAHMIVSSGRSAAHTLRARSELLAEKYVRLISHVGVLATVNAVISGQSLVVHTLKAVRPSAKRSVDVKHRHVIRFAQVLRQAVAVDLRPLRSCEMS